MRNAAAYASQTGALPRPRRRAAREIRGGVRLVNRAGLRAILPFFRFRAWRMIAPHLSPNCRPRAANRAKRPMVRSLRMNFPKRLQVGALGVGLMLATLAPVVQAEAAQVLATVNGINITDDDLRIA